MTDRPSGDGPSTNDPGAHAPPLPGVLPGVLIVDDSSMMRALLTRLVGEDGGFRVAGTAADGRQAIDQARALQPDVCLLDLEMPVLGGLAALPAIRAVSRAAVIVVSSAAELGSAERRAVLMAGADAVVAKPSGAISPDLVRTRGQAILTAMCAVLSPPLPDDLDSGLTVGDEIYGEDDGAPAPGGGDDGGPSLEDLLRGAPAAGEGP
ncbi:CheY-like chemotaxis protein [Azospirillum fermentarium]|uniref:response regulator n=1 Tax=Azospirillum fermentarium TaxID=1233114 RepID=UPI00222686B5|nr:response regulator [Azospirillum fermentarium]MCW2249222.1 CheY-like chemotaxis protein [Azospirillum fermentarium]